MARKRIALDVDNTIADTFGYMHRYMLREHGIDYNKMGFRSMCSDELVEKTGLTELQLRRILSRFGKTCTDCACIYENYLFDQIPKVSHGIKGKKFF